jgi:hypothetical protein
MQETSISKKNSHTKPQLMSDSKEDEKKDLAAANQYTGELRG